MSSSSWMNDWQRYRQSRFPCGLYLPLAILLCTAAHVSEQSVDATRLAVEFILALSLLFQFRLWDDLSDLERDRVEHSQRVLCQATSLTHFRILLFASFALNIAVVAIVGPASSLMVFLGLNGFFLVGYQFLAALRIGRKKGSRRNKGTRYRFPGTGPAGAWHKWYRTLFSRSALRRRCRFCYHGVLLKYPVFVYLLSPAVKGADAALLAYAMATVYLCFCVYEILHDKTLHQFRSATRLLGLEMTALGLIASLMLFQQAGLDGPRSLAQLIFAIGSCGILADLFRRHLHHIAPGRWCYTVFVLGFLWLLDCVLINSESFQAMSEMRIPE